MKNIQPFLIRSLLALTLALTLTSSLAKAEIRELRSMVEAVATVEPHTLVVFDLDNTVFEARQMLGSDQFFTYVFEVAKQRGLPEPQAKEVALAKAAVVQPRTPVQAVEPVTPSLIHQLQQRKIYVMALTSRPAAWVEGTLMQVHSLGLNFSVTTPRFNPAPMAGAGQLAEGVFFLAKGSNKGAAMLEILKQLPPTLNRILFIDDKVNNVESVEHALMQTRVAHLSIRYGAADPKVAAFRADVARCQWQAFMGRQGFISDSAAVSAIARGACR